MADDKRIPLFLQQGLPGWAKLSVLRCSRDWEGLYLNGGNNAIIISKNADIDIAIRGAVFGAVGYGGPTVYNHPPAYCPGRSL
jgi:aldehyde dehydrogenase (NAD+)